MSSKLSEEKKQMDNKRENSQENNFNNNLLKEMAENAVLYGYKISKTNPKIKPFIIAVKGTVGIINLEITLNQLGKAIDFLKKEIDNKKMILLVGTTPASQEAVKKFAQEFNFPYVLNKWLGGTLTNFKVIRSRIDYYLKTKQDKEKGNWLKYTKKEKIKITKEFTKLENNFRTLVLMEKLPDALFIINPKDNETAVREALKLNIPIIALMGTNYDPDKINYPIVCNDRAKKSIDWLIDFIIKKIKENGKDGQN